MKKRLGGLSVFDFTMLFGRFVDSLLNIGFRTQASFPVEDGVTEFLLAQRLSGLLSLAFVNAALSFCGRALGRYASRKACGSVH